MTVSTKALLEKLLANTYVVLMLTQKIHWHVQGSEFYAIHLMTESQYNELQQAIDDIAEHMRSMQLDVPAGMEQYTSLTSIPEEKEIMLSTETMLAHLIDAHATLKKDLVDLREVSGGEGDVATEDIAIDRIRAHDKHVWMLKSSIQ